MRLISAFDYELMDSRVCHREYKHKTVLGAFERYWLSFSLNTLMNKSVGLPLLIIF